MDVMGYVGVIDKGRDYNRWVVQGICPGFTPLIIQQCIKSVQEACS